MTLGITSLRCIANPDSTDYEGPTGRYPHCFLKLGQARYPGSAHGAKDLPVDPCQSPCRRTSLPLPGKCRTYGLVLSRLGASQPSILCRSCFYTLTWLLVVPYHYSPVRIRQHIVCSLRMYLLGLEQGLPK